MSENQSGFSVFNNTGLPAEQKAYQWGFNFKSIKGANTDMTYGWKGSGVFGLSTSFYVSPLALGAWLVGAGVGAGGGALVAALNGGDVKEDAATGASIGTVVSPFSALAILTEIFKSETLYKGMVLSNNVIFPISTTWRTEIAKRKFPGDYAMSFPAYMTVEMGAKTDAIYGNKWDFVTGTVNKMVNGETVQCKADKVEWYDANLYKYITGTETKMDASKIPKIPAGTPNKLTQQEVLGNKTKYVENYDTYGEQIKLIADKGLSHSTCANLEQFAEGDYSLDSTNQTMVSSKNCNQTCGGTYSVKAFGAATIESTSGSITLQSGSNPSIQITAAQTQIKNKLSLGIPGFNAPPDVGKALAQASEAFLKLKAQQTKAKAQITALAIKAGLM